MNEESSKNKNTRIINVSSEMILNIPKGIGARNSPFLLFKCKFTAHDDLIVVKVERGTNVFLMGNFLQILLL